MGHVETIIGKHLYIILLLLEKEFKKNKQILKESLKTFQIGR